MKKTKLKHVLAIALFCMVMSIGFACLADEQATVNVKSATIRASADPNSEKIGSVPSGKTIDVIGQASGTDGSTWYQVYVNGDTKGYIRSDLLKLKDGASLKKVDAGAVAPAQNANTAPTSATAVDAKKATVVNNNVRIRTGASTEHDSVGTANRGMVVTVTGEANGTDGKKWYQVSFTYNNSEKTGFIRSDLLTFDNVPPDVAQSQITGVGNAGEGDNGEAGTGGETAQPETETPEELPPEPEPESQQGKKEVTPMEASGEPYVMPGFTLFDLVDGGQKYTAYKNGSFYIIYGQRQDGEEGWFIFDSDKGTYTRYPYTASGVETSDKKTVSILVVIVLIIVIVALVTVVGLLLIKLKENDTYERGYDSDDYPDDIADDLEELGLDDEEYMAPSRARGGRPVRQPQGHRPQKGNAPQERRPQPGTRPLAGEQPQGRRPQPGAKPLAGEQPQGRRPQPQGGQPQGGQRPSGGQPQGRRPQPSGGQPQGGPRPSGGGQPQGRQPQGKRSQPQNEKVPPQKGLKAKNLLDEDDDMDFMDI